MGSYLIVSQVLIGVGLWMLKAIQAEAVEAAGYYVASLNLTRIFMVIPSVVSVVLFTSLAWALSRSDERKVRDFLQGATRFGLVLLIPGCTLVVIDAEGIMVLLFSELYRGGENILRYLSIAFGSMAFFDILVNALMAAGAFWKSVTTVIVILPVLVALSWYLIGYMGADGAALALAITMVTAALVASVVT
jgi:O-antigen/teichoic acid export membrane protein